MAKKKSDEISDDESTPVLAPTAEVVAVDAAPVPVLPKYTLTYNLGHETEVFHANEITRHFGSLGVVSTTSNGKLEVY